MHNNFFLWGGCGSYLCWKIFRMALIFPDLQQCPWLNLLLIGKSHVLVISWNPQGGCWTQGFHRNATLVNQGIPVGSPVSTLFFCSLWFLKNTPTFLGWKRKGTVPFFFHQPRNSNFPYLGNLRTNITSTF